MKFNEEHKLRLAYIAGFIGGRNAKIDPKKLETHYGIDLEQEIIHAGFEQFLSDLPNLLEMLSEEDAPVQIDLDLDIHL